MSFQTYKVTVVRTEMFKIEAHSKAEAEIEAGIQAARNEKPDEIESIWIDDCVLDRPWLHRRFSRAPYAG